MEEIAKTFGNIGLTPKLHLSTADRYRFVGTSPLAEEGPENRHRQIRRRLRAVHDGLEGC